MKPGRDADGIARTEIEHYGNCPVCGALVDMRDLAQLLGHTHGAAIETGQGDEPPVDFQIGCSCRKHP